MRAHRRVFALALLNLSGLWLCLYFATPRTDPISLPPPPPIPTLAPGEQLTFPLTATNLTGEAPFDGPPPTDDPRSWRLIGSARVLQALIEVDSREGLSISAAQAGQVATWRDSVATWEPTTNASEATFCEAVARTLTPAQNTIVSDERARLERASVDTDDVLKRLRGRAPHGGVPPALSRRDPPAQTTQPVGRCVAAIDRFLKPGRHALTPAQADALCGPLEDLTRNIEPRVAAYEQLLGILTNDQRQALTHVLQDVHAGRLDASGVFTPLNNSDVWFPERAGR